MSSDESVTAFFSNVDAIANEANGEPKIKDIKGVIKYVNDEVISKVNQMDEKISDLDASLREAHLSSAQVKFALHDLETKIPEQIDRALNNALEEKFKKYLGKPVTEPQISQTQTTNTDSNKISIMDTVKSMIDKDGKLDLKGLLSSGMFKLDPESMKNGAETVKQLVANFFDVINMIADNFKKFQGGSSAPVTASGDNGIYSAYNYLIGKKIEKNFLKEITTLQRELGVKLPPNLMLKSLETAIKTVDEVTHRHVG